MFVIEKETLIATDSKKKSYVTPPEIKRIRNGAFTNSGIKEVTISENVEIFGDNVFYNAKKLEKAKLPNWMTIIPKMTFTNCFSLTEVHFSKNLKIIGKDAFAYCGKLNHITFPSTLQELETKAFSHSGLYEINLPNSVTELGEGVFACNYNLTSIKLSENLKTISREAFYNCDSIKTIELPDSVEKIDALAFCNCSKLAKVRLPENLKAVEKFAFEGCPLNTVILPESVEFVLANSFDKSTTVYLSEKTLKQNPTLCNFPNFKPYDLESLLTIYSLKKANEIINKNSKNIER